MQDTKIATSIKGKVILDNRRGNRSSGVILCWWEQRNVRISASFTSNGRIGIAWTGRIGVRQLHVGRRLSLRINVSSQNRFAQRNKAVVIRKKNTYISRMSGITKTIVVNSKVSSLTSRGESKAAVYLLCHHSNEANLKVKQDRCCAVPHLVHILIRAIDTYGGNLISRKSFQHCLSVG
jgi:hypothetical protein